MQSNYPNKAMEPQSTKAELPQAPKQGAPLQEFSFTGDETRPRMTIKAETREEAERKYEELCKLNNNE